MSELSESAKGGINSDSEPPAKVCICENWEGISEYDSAPAERTGNGAGAVEDCEIG